MTLRTTFVDTQIADYKYIVERYNASAINLITLADPFTGHLFIQNYLTTNNLNPNDVDVVSASSSLSGLFTKRVIFVDPGVADYQTLITGLGTHATIVVLDANKDGVQQIHDYLMSNASLVSAVGTHLDGIKSLDVISHGDAGTLYLGSTILTKNNINQYDELLSDIGDQLAEDANILLYGCYVAAGDVGQQFIDQLADATGVDVVASTNLTGAAALGGDWVLGAVNAGGMVQADPLRASSYQGILVTISSGTWNNSQTVLEQATAVVIDNNVTVSNWSAGANTSLLVSIASPHAGDQLTVKSTAGNQQISVSGSNINYTTGGNVILIGTINSTNNGLNGNPLKIDLNASVTDFRIDLLAKVKARRKAIFFGAVAKLKRTIRQSVDH